MTVWILIEDARSKSGKAYKVLARKLMGRQKVHLKSLQRSELLDSAKLAVHLRNLGNPAAISRAVVCIDSHSSEEPVKAVIAGLRGEVNKQFPFPIKYVVVVHALESWLLEDPEAVRKVLPLRSSDHQLRRMGRGCQPDRAISEACGVFAKSRHDERIAQRLDVKLLESRSGSFREFVAALRNPQ